MGILDDINESKNLLKNISLFSKICISITIFMAVSSIASLSETLFKWKEFISEGISFYRKYLVEPMIYWGSKIGLEYTENKVHCLVLASIALSIGMHLLAVGQQITFDQINKKYSGSNKPKLIIFRLIPLIAIPLLALKFGFSPKSLHIMNRIILVISKLIIL